MKGFRSMPAAVFKSIFSVALGAALVLNSGCGSRQVKIPERMGLSEYYLFCFFYPGLAPVKDTAYRHSTGDLHVLQSVPGGVLVNSDSNNGIIMVKTSREYVDNARLEIGLYVYLGPYEYQTALGVAKRVYCFAEVPETVANKMLGKTKSNKSAATAEGQSNYQKTKALWQKPDAQTK